MNRGISTYCGDRLRAAALLLFPSGELFAKGGGKGGGKGGTVNVRPYEEGRHIRCPSSPERPGRIQERSHICTGGLVWSSRYPTTLSAS
jgi:hypothetical protein